MRRGMLWVVVVGILMAGLAFGPDLWAAPGQNLGRQTVPTRTPVPPPPTEPPPPPPTEPPPSPPTEPPPADQPTPAPTAAVKTTSAGGASEPLLPGAGGRSIRLHLGAMMIVAGLLVLVVVRRRA